MKEHETLVDIFSADRFTEVWLQKQKQRNITTRRKSLTLYVPNILTLILPTYPEQNLWTVLGELVVRQTLTQTWEFTCQILHTVPHITGYKLKGEVCIWSAVGWYCAFLLDRMKPASVFLTLFVFQIHECTLHLLVTSIVQKIDQRQEKITNFINAFASVYKCCKLGVYTFCARNSYYKLN